MILAVLGEAASRRVEVAAIKRFIELFGDARRLVSVMFKEALL
ncbi:MAG TPA: hypothetical protein VEI01_18105 [Terriglobales bacterium]|nr:hypothetical protein [Terriglobales bacterium]